MKVSGEKGKDVGQSFRLWRWGWQDAMQPGQDSQLQMASSGQGHGGQQLLPLVTGLSVFRQEPPGSYNTGAFILVAEVPARGQKGRRGP